MKGINCSDSYQEDVNLIAIICGLISAIIAIIVVTLIIPNDVFVIGKLWGIGIHRHYVIACCSLIAFPIAYFAVKIFCCWRCPGKLKGAGNDDDCRLILYDGG